MQKDGQIRIGGGTWNVIALEAVSQPLSEEELAARRITPSVHIRGEHEHRFDRPHRSCAWTAESEQPLNDHASLRRLQWPLQHN
jgi:hypothetical protein